MSWWWHSFWLSYHKKRRLYHRMKVKEHDADITYHVEKMFHWERLDES